MARHILGIEIDEKHPGYKRFKIRPRPGGGVTWARGSHDSCRGLIETAWSIEKKTFRLSVTVPVGSIAEVYVPAKDAASVTEGGKPALKAEGVKFLRTEDGNAVFEIRSGRYEFTSPPGVAR